MATIADTLPQVAPAAEPRTHPLRRLLRRRFATVLGVAAAGVALMVGYLAFGGPNVWLTKGIDLAALLGAAILAVAVFLVAGRLARAEREPVTGA